MKRRSGWANASETRATMRSARRCSKKWSPCSTLRHLLCRRSRRGQHRSTAGDRRRQRPLHTLADGLESRLVLLRARVVSSPAVRSVCRLRRGMASGGGGDGDRGGRQVARALAPAFERAYRSQRIALSMRSRITLARESWRIRSVSRNRYHTSSGRRGSTASIDGGTVDTGLPFG